MIKKLSLLIFMFISLIDSVFKFFTKKSFLIYFSDFLQLETELDDMKFHIPNNLILWRVKTLYTKEPETIEWIKSFEKDSIFWDIGSNIGLYSIYAAKKKKSVVYSFEPSTSNVRIFSRNIYLNDLTNKIHLLPIALNENNKIHFSLIKESTFIEGGAENAFSVDYDWKGEFFKPANEYKTIGTSLDFLSENEIIPIPNYIKIDVDGIEHLILNGGKNTLKNKKIKSVLIELNEDFKKQYQTCLDIMRKSNFKLYKKVPTSIVSETKYNNQYNYIFIK